MILALLAMDLVWALGLVLVATPAAIAAFATFRAIAASGQPLSVGLGAACAFAGFVTVYVLAVCLVLLVLPSPAVGKHPLLRGKDFYLWAIGLIVRRWLDVAPIGTLLRQSAIGRLVYLRSGGARVHPSANMSSDVVILDPAGFVLGKGSMLGAATTITGHMVVGDVLTIAPVVLGASVETGGDVRIGPGVVAGDRVVLSPGALIGPFTRIEDDASVGMRATLGANVKVGRRARIAAHAYVPTGTVIQEDGFFPPK